MAVIGWLVFSSTGATACLVIGAVWALISRGSLASRRFLAVCAVGYWLAGSYIVPETVRGWLTHGYAPLTRADVPAGRTAVVVLGSGSHQFRDWSEGQFVVVDQIGAARLLEAARVFRLLEADFIVSSGGLIRPTPRTWPSGLAMAEDLVRLGVPRDRIIVESASKTTRDQAVLVKELLRIAPGRPRGARHVTGPHAPLGGSVPRGGRRGNSRHRPRTPGRGPMVGKADSDR